jgi:MFS family permease
MQPTTQARLSFLERIGMYPELAIGYLGLLLFMVGDGVEAGFLSPYLMELHFTARQVAIVFTAYGISAAIASWLSGALSDIFGPRKVMWAGLLIWLGFEIPFLTAGIAHANYFIIVLSYGLRGFGYPLFLSGSPPSPRSAILPHPSGGSGRPVPAACPRSVLCSPVSSFL